MRASRSVTIPAAAVLMAGVGLAVPGQAGAAPMDTGTKAVTVTPAELPPRSVEHEERYWTWFGPRRWIASSGVYGITIRSNDGRRVLDFGFNSTLCTPAPTVEASVASYFRSQLSTFRQSSGIRRLKVRKLRIVQLPSMSYGALYFRQAYRWKGRLDGERYGGEIVNDYSLANGPTYCYVANQSRSAPARGLKRSLRQLRSIHTALAYFGPGAPHTPPLGGKAEAGA